MSDDETEYLTLKWGTPKSWRLNDANMAILRRYADLGWSGSAMLQPNTDAYKAVLCELIDDLTVDYVYNDWTGEQMTKDAAKDYVMTYGKARS